MKLAGLTRLRKPARVAKLGLATLAFTAVLAGCGPGAGKSTQDAELTVSHDFGTVVVKQVTQPKVPGSETVMSLLERYAKVSTAYGGGFVQSIDGLAGDASNHVAWFYYVNGSLAGKGAELTAVGANDRIWWDRHDWRASEGTPAVVGSYPAPFSDGVSGKPERTVIACGTGLAGVCAAVARELERVGVKPTTAPLAATTRAGTITIEVATTSELASYESGRLLAAGPGQSGVYARPSGQALQLLTPAGKVARRLAGQWGLIAATQQFSAAVPTWVVCGDTLGGVALAAARFDAANLVNRFAIAVSETATIALPLDASR